MNYHNTIYLGVVLIGIGWALSQKKWTGTREDMKETVLWWLLWFVAFAVCMAASKSNGQCDSSTEVCLIYINATSHPINPGGIGTQGCACNGNNIIVSPWATSGSVGAGATAAAISEINFEPCGYPSCVTPSNLYCASTWSDSTTGYPVVVIDPSSVVSLGYTAGIVTFTAYNPGQVPGSSSNAWSGSFVNKGQPGWFGITDPCANGGSIQEENLDGFMVQTVNQSGNGVYTTSSIGCNLTETGATAQNWLPVDAQGDMAVYLGTGQAYNYNQSYPSAMGAGCPRIAQINGPPPDTTGTSGGLVTAPGWTGMCPGTEYAMSNQLIQSVGGSAGGNQNTTNIASNSNQLQNIATQLQNASATVGTNSIGAVTAAGDSAMLSDLDELVQLGLYQDSQLNQIYGWATNHIQGSNGVSSSGSGVTNTNGVTVSVVVSNVSSNLLYQWYTNESQTVSNTVGNTLSAMFSNVNYISNAMAQDGGVVSQLLSLSNGLTGYSSDYTFPDYSSGFEVQQTIADPQGVLGSNADVSVNFNPFLFDANGIPLVVKTQVQQMSTSISLFIKTVETWFLAVILMTKIYRDSLKACGNIYSVTQLKSLDLDIGGFSVGKGLMPLYFATAISVFWLIPTLAVAFGSTHAALGFMSINPLDTIVAGQSTEMGMCMWLVGQFVPIGYLIYCAITYLLFLVSLQTMVCMVAVVFKFLMV